MESAPILSSASTVVRKSGLPEAEIDNELIMLDVDGGLYFNLNAVGTRVWRLIADQIAVSEICTTLRAEYSVDTDTCERQVIALLKDMQRNGMIEVCGAEGPPSMTAS